MSNLIFLISSIVFSIISTRDFYGLSTSKRYVLHYFIPQFQKWTAYSHSSIPHIIVFYVVQYALFCSTYFLSQSISSFKKLNERCCWVFWYLVKQEQGQFYYMKTHFCPWLNSIGKYHLAQKGTHIVEKCNQWRAEAWGSGWGRCK